MSLEEMESTWSTQRSAAPANEARQRVDQAQRSFRRHAWLLLVGVLGNLIGLALQLHRVATVPGRTVANSAWELLIPGLTLLICLGGAVLLYRSHRRYQTLKHDTRRCLELVLKEKRQEITALTLWLPFTYVAFLGLIVLSKFQSIAAGFESPGNAWSGVAMAAGLFIFISAFLIHRAHAFIKPEVADLDRTLNSLVAD